MLRCHEPAKRWPARKEKKVGKPTALGILAAKLGRTVYHPWHKQRAFDAKRRGFRDRLPLHFARDGGLLGV
jgi:hypothetical protein